MDILVLGGTQFVGRHIVEHLVACGHCVSVFNRGLTPDELPETVQRLHGDRNLGIEGLSALQGRTWDACIDVSGYTAVQVHTSAELLRRAVGRYVYISAVSVYGDPAAGPVDESFPLSPPATEDVSELNQETYGRLKVTCEKIVSELFADRGTLLRPQIVAGAHDPLDRCSYWVRRTMQTGEMLGPGDGSDYLQFIDAVDVARFVATVCEQGISGCFNLAGHRLTWRQFLELLGAGGVAWVPHDIITTAGLTESELPLYRRVGGPRSRLMHVSPARAVAAGLILSDPADTIARIRHWLPSSNLAPALSPERESALIHWARAKL